MISKEMHSGIVYYTKLFSDNLNIVDLIEQDELSSTSKITKWSSWGPSDNKVIYGERKLIDNSFSEFDASRLDYSITKTITDSIIKCSGDYSKKYNLDIGKLRSLSISKYFQNQGMGQHIDSYGENPKEILSIVLYLNDNYEGGELYFPNQGIQFKPKRGAAYFFPGDKEYIHGVTEVKSSLRYTCPFFWEILEHTGDRKP